ncbi:MAG: hypothetical protein AVDCRST_MAG68-3495 [uncultured Gemmatimonadetes bacterium]|uniref:Uncharacterized protein n=1 Tax=uncultured Gemmatimonadota bacterium TaxID=203437 RepID=A0A6J4M608_9BACT|nr:MAG: hypothetical protein AVDCRST_MAG68-3495 [uncultured Gemmatimonadota bacterium]
MNILDVQQAQLEYLAVLDRPAFPLWANVPGMMGGLYQAFEGLHSGLADLTLEGDGRDPLGRTIVVSLGEQGFFRVGYERVEAELPDYTEDELAAFPATLARGDRWLRTHWSAAVVQAHYLTLSIHGTLSEGSSADYLRSLSAIELGIGKSLGTGLIFHASLPTTGWDVHLTLDHSTVIEGGLFVQYVVTIGDDRIDHARTLDASFSFLNQGAESLGLEIGIGAVG